LGLNNRIMDGFLESQIGLLERGSESVAPPDAERARLVEDLIAFQLTALERLEKHLGPGGLSERDRPLVPLFQRWLNAARKVKELVKELQGGGQTVAGYDDLLRAMNRSKPVAESFDHFVQLNAALVALADDSKRRATGG
jgi:hypothetical protein